MKYRSRLEVIISRLSKLLDGKVWISTSTGIFLWTGEEIVRAFDNIAGISNMTLLEGCYALAFTIVHIPYQYP